jgi:hypothetical protein
VARIAVVGAFFLLQARAQVLAFRPCVFCAYRFICRRNTSLNLGYVNAHFRHLLVAIKAYPLGSAANDSIDTQFIVDLQRS